MYKTIRLSDGNFNERPVSKTIKTPATIVVAWNFLSRQTSTFSASKWPFIIASVAAARGRTRQPHRARRTALRDRFQRRRAGLREVCGPAADREGSIRAGEPPARRHAGYSGDHRYATRSSSAPNSRARRELDRRARRSSSRLWQRRSAAAQRASWTSTARPSRPSWTGCAGRWQRPA